MRTENDRIGVRVALQKGTPCYSSFFDKGVEWRALFRSGALNGTVDDIAKDNCGFAMRVDANADMARCMSVARF